LTVGTGLMKVAAVAEAKVRPRVRVAMAAFRMVGNI
jgi:hypothetical protein